MGPLIAIVACLGLSVDLATNSSTKAKLSKAADNDAVYEIFTEKVEYLKTSRPTAVNLFNALEELTASVKQVLVKKRGTNATESIVSAVISYAEMMLERDVSDNKAIGDHG